jgi:hypothetical protein
MAVSTLTRLGLRLATGAATQASPLTDLRVFAVGFGYDLLTFVYFAWPLVLLLWVLPQRWSTLRRGRWPVATLVLRAAVRDRIRRRGRMDVLG